MQRLKGAVVKKLFVVCEIYGKHSRFERTEIPKKKKNHGMEFPRKMRINK